jgi:hypothetical protein
MTTPTLTMFNITRKGWLVLYLEADGRKFFRRIDLKREGAGLWVAGRTTEPRLIFCRASFEKQDETCSIVWEWCEGQISVRCSASLAAIARELLWHTSWKFLQEVA